MKKVTSIVLNGFTNDSRVLKENLSLKRSGYDVKILAILKEGLKEKEVIEGIPVHRLTMNKKLLENNNKDINQALENTELLEVINNEDSKIIDLLKNTKEIADAKSHNNMIDINLEDDIESEFLEKNDNENTDISKQSISFNSFKDKDLPLAGKLLIALKLLIGLLRRSRRFFIRTGKKILGLLRRLRRFFIRTGKKIFNFFKRAKRKFLNKYFRLHKFKFNMMFVKECKDSDIIHCNDLYTLPMGVIVKKFYNKNVKIVYDAHEYETEVNGLTGNKKRFRKVMERSLIRYADKVICVSDAIALEYQRLYKIKKPSLVLNTPEYQKIEKKNFFREKLGISDEQTIFLYQGGLSKGRGIEILLDTFKELDKDTVIVFMGYGPLEELVIEASDKYANIYFHEAVSPKVLLGFTSSADFGILFYENNCLNHYYCSPNKMFEYLMAELPVIASNLYEMKRLVENNNIGAVAKDNSIEGLKEAIKDATKLDKKELQNNINKVKTIYNWEEQEKILLEVYSDL